MKKGGNISTSFGLIMVLVICSILIIGGNGNIATAGMYHPTFVEVTIESNGNITKINYKIGEFVKEKLQINGEEYYRIILGKESNIMEKGKPDLSNICRSIIILDDAKMDIRVTNADHQDYGGMMIAPSKGILPRTINPSDVPYEFGEVYEKNDWYPGKIAELGEPYILRDFRGQVVKVNPFQYNPITKKLRFYTDITIEVYPIGPGEINVYDRKEPLTAIDIDFKPIYERHFLNFDMDRYTPVGEQGNMLVICYDSFYSTIEPFVTWKNTKGIPTKIVNFSTIGNSATDIKNYIVNYYNTYGLTFVLLVGDIQQIPTLYSGGGASDPSYSYIVGSDHYPDLFVGRFSAQNVAQVETQVERTVEYEKYPNASADWYHNGTGIASNGGPGDDGEYDWQHMRNIRTDLLGYTYSEVDEFYDGSHGGGDASGNPTSSMVSNAVNDGRSIINYCGHGGPTSWGTSGFNNNDINNLVNDNMLPFIWSVACNNGEFDNYDTCFAEAWLRATHNDEPAGAVAVFASSIGQYWDPPMDAQDEMVDILVESYPNNIKHTYGALCFNGCMHMNDEYGSSGYDMTDTWHVFGDPSLQVRTDTPTNMTVQHEPVIPIGSSTFEIIVVGIEDALCALSKDGDLLGSAYTNETGMAIINLSEPIDESGELDFVVTAYNKIPYITTIIAGDTIPPEILNVSYYPPSQVVGGYVNISCIVIDNVDVDTVKVNITYSGGYLINVSMEQLADGIYYYNSTYSIPGEYGFFIWANDSNNNENTSDGYSFSIIDTKPPEITNVMDYPDPQEMNEWVNITCDVMDNVEVDNVKVNITYPDDSHTIERMVRIDDNYYFNKTYSIPGIYSYFIWANDTSGNENTSGNYTFTIQDTIKPDITNIMDYPDPQEIGGWVNITCDVSDNVAVDEVRVIITYPNGTIQDFPMMGDYYFNQSYEQLGKYSYIIWANDTIGNEIESTRYSFRILYPKATMVVDPDPPSHDFGNAMVNGIRKWKIEISNTGIEDLEWNINTDEEWTSINPSSGTLFAGNSIIVEVTIDTNLSGGYHVGNISIYSNGGNRNGSIELYVVTSPLTGHITSLQQDWNLFSLPFNYSINLDQLSFLYDGTEYSWDESIAEHIIYGVIYDWDRTKQRYNYYYELSDALYPGRGYWIISHEECELRYNISYSGSPVEAPTGNYIATLKENWNCFGLPFNHSVALEQICVVYDGTEYNWTEAIDAHIIYGVIYDWNRSEQQYHYLYHLTDELNPGYGYWIISCQECELWYDLS